MNKRTKFFAALFIGLLLTANGLGQDEPKYSELPNFHQVNSNLYRGAQPEKNGLQRLKDLGIKTVINLRDTGDLSKTEEKTAAAMGIQYFNVPLPNFNRPDDATVARILELINSSENQPVFVHCKRGSDRTGTIMAVYRISHDGWTGEKATAEAKRFGLGFWQLGMKDYIHDYYIRHSHNDQTTTKQTPQLLF